METDISEDRSYAFNSISPGNESLRGIESINLSGNFELADCTTSFLSDNMSTPTKMPTQVLSSDRSIPISDMDTLNTPQKKLPDENIQLVHDLTLERAALFLVTHSTPPKRRLAPKPHSTGNVSKVSPLLIKYRKISKKKTTTKLKFILPKQRQIIKTTIKGRVLKSKPPKEINILPSSAVEPEEVLATPLADETQEEYINGETSEKHTNFDEDITDLLESEEIEDSAMVDSFGKIIIQRNMNFTKTTNSEQMQKEDHLAALFKASSTIAEKRQNERKSSGGHMLNTQQRRLQARIAALSCCENELEDKTSTALNFLKRANEHLHEHPSVFNDFICALQEFDASGEMPECLYLKVAKIFYDFPLLSDEFVMFLKPHQAMSVGKYKEYCEGLRLRDFIQKLQQLYGKNQLQIQKLLKLMQSKQPFNEDIDTIKVKLAPILRPAHLLDSFAQCFSSETPPPCLPSDYEEMVLDSPGTPDSCEHINLVDDDQPTSPDRPCTCECHASQSSSQIKANHCQSCGITFIDGRIYLRSGKTLKPAKVTYLVDKTEENKETKNNNVKSKTSRRTKNSQARKEIKP